MDFRDFALYHEDTSAFDKLTYNHIDGALSATLVPVKFEDCEKLKAFEESGVAEELIGLLQQRAAKEIECKNLNDLLMEAKMYFYRLTVRFQPNTVIVGNKVQADALSTDGFKNAIYSSLLGEDEFLFLFTGSDPQSSAAIVLQKDGEFRVDITDSLILKGRLVK